jgi:hypothetical protein
MATAKFRQGLAGEFALIAFLLMPSPAVSQTIESNWPLDESAGDIARDLSGHGYDGTLYGGPTWTAEGILSNGLAFDGVDDFVEISDGAGYPDSIGALSTGTISLWFKFDTIPGANTIHPIFFLGKSTGGTTRSGVIIEIGHFNAGNTQLFFTILAPDGTIPLCFDSNVGLQTGTWYHFAAVVGPDFNTGYLNGAEMTGRDYNFGNAASSYFFDDVAKEICWLGQGFLSTITTVQHFDGTIDEVRIYNYPLTAQEINDYYNSVIGGPGQPTGLQGVHQNGQTFLTWNELGGAGVRYRLYRSTEPIASAAQLTDANRLGETDDQTSYNTRLSDIRGSSRFFVIESGEPPLAAEKGVFVHTTAGGGAFYYAVTSVVGGVENTALVPGQNTLGGPVSETVATPVPIPQGTETISGRTYDVYTHWTSPAGHADYPAMAPLGAASVPHNFALYRRGTGQTHPLLLRLHARGGNFLGGTGTSNTEEWVLFPDDYLPNDIRNSFWYGYHENFNLATGQPVPATGTVHDYTARRVRWTIDWALANLPIDKTRVYMTGGSMGGVGSAFLSISMPDKIAAVYTTVPKFDFSFLHDPNPANQWNEGNPERAIGDRLWGTVPTNLPSSDGYPVYERLNAGALALRYEATDIPPIVAFNGKNDTVVGWAEKIGYYVAMNQARQFGWLFWDSRTHNGTGAEWQPQQNPSAYLYRFRLDQSYPTFSNSSANGDPGDGAASSGDALGTINGNLSWDEAMVADTRTRYEITLRSISLQSTQGTIPAPASCAADVTVRRLQNLLHIPGLRLTFQNLQQPEGTLIQQGEVITDSLGRVTVLGMAITPAGNRLILEPLLAPADFDLDGDVDAADFTVFAGCASGPAIPHDGTPNCQNADLDHDSDVDQSDFGLFQRCYSGEGNLANSECVE